jgi:putative hydrolase of the HAD superfamily
VVATAGETGAWARLERGELTVATFCAPFEADCRAQGLTVDSARLMAYVAEAGVPRPQMLEAIRRIRAQGLRVGALTNNWKREDAEDDVMRDRLRALFDVFIESRVVGLHKPDPRIYTLACDALGVAPARTAFLDDIGRNLKPARELGMTTIKVDDPDQALRELGCCWVSRWPERASGRRYRDLRAGGVGRGQVAQAQARPQERAARRLQLRAPTSPVSRAPPRSSCSRASCSAGTSSSADLRDDDRPPVGWSGDARPRAGRR